jgi:hypothetical protein
MSTVWQVEPKLDIGKVASRTFAAIGANLVPFAVLSLLLSGIPTALITFGSSFMQSWAMSQTTSGELSGYSSSDIGTIMLVSIGSGLLAMVLMLVPAYVLLGAITHSSIVFYNGGRATLAESLGTGVRKTLTLIGLALISGVAIAFLLMLLIFPGLMAMVAWIVAAPAVVVEGKGVFGSISRSRELTKGSRWRIFWLVMIYWVISSAIQTAVTLPAGMLGGTPSYGEFSAYADPLSPRNLILNGFTVLSSVITSVIAAAGAAALYSELRTVKEGASTDELAQVFS